MCSGVGIVAGVEGFVEGMVAGFACVDTDMIWTCLVKVFIM